MKYLAYAASLFLFLTFSCREPFDDEVIIEENHTPIILENYEPSSKLITGSVFGTIVDEQGIIITDAVVKLGNMQVSSDVLGTFKFETVSMNQRGTYIDIKKEGYFDSGRRFYPSEGGLQELRITLIPTTFDQRFQSDESTTIDINGGGFIEFTANTIVDQQGQLYNGLVDVATTRLTAGEIASLDKMPGSLQGVNLLNQEVTMESFGIIGVELRGSEGQRLNIANGSTAKIHFDLPEALAANAPKEVALWSFNETYGIWTEESTATLINSQYVGEVAHFSFWHFSNSDFFDLVYLDFKLVNSFNNAPIRGAKVVLSTEITYPFNNYNFLSSRIDYSNWKGEIEGYIPKDKEISMDVFSPCGDVIYSQIIGPFTDDMTMNDVVMNDLVMIELKGQVVNCDGALTEEGFLSVKVDNKNYNFILQENSFTVSVPACFNTTEVEVAGGDLATLEQGEFITLPAGELVNVGSLAACGEELIGYAKVVIDQTLTIYYEVNSIRPIPEVSNPFVSYLDCRSQASEALNESLKFQVRMSGSANASGFANEAGDYTDFHDTDVFIDTANEWEVRNGVFEKYIVEQYVNEPGGLVSGYAFGELLNVYNNVNTTHFVELTFSGERAVE